VTEIAARADALKAEVQAAVGELAGALASNDQVALRNALLHAAALATPNAWPPDLSALAAQATAARVYLQAVVDQITQAEAGVAGKVLAPLNAVAHHTERIKLALGRAFPVLPRFTAGNAAALSASLNDRTALCAQEPLNLSGWLRQMALVRPGAEALSSVLSGAMLIGGLATDPAGFALAQLPHRPGQRWLALPEAAADDKSPQGVGGEVAIFAHITAALDATKPLAGFVCDEWTEMIPNDVETTGVTFHYDAPAARPPQMVILAVPPDPNAPQWNLQTLLDTVDETLRLAQLRMVGPKDIEVLHSNLLPAVYLPHNFTKDVPSVDLLRLRDLYKAKVRTAGVLGKEIL
jgi:hypothetical protein